MIVTRGGYREEAGRKSAYPGVDLKPFAMDLTPAGVRLLDKLCKRTGLTRNNVLAHLTNLYADRLAFPGQDGVLYAGKAQSVLSIRMPADIGAKLRAARQRTGKSYSDLGEALIRLYGETTEFPAPPESKRQQREKQQRRQRRRAGVRRTTLA